MPMTQVKGQLRETAERLATGAHAGWNDEGLTELFGYRPPEGETVIAGAGLPGALAFRGEARMPEAALRHFRGEPGRNDRGKLFRRIAATRINELGVAQDKTLRAIEVCVPLALEAMVEWIAGNPPRQDWVRLLDAACAATTAFGKLKADGYGRAIASVAEPRS
ncbi:MAG: hypothetical protein ACHQAQ_09720 [Hyphomicrobiales bacterium]